ncbi:MAG: NTE family protein [Salibacteraceae bacterium]|jgi:NTE family protein
MPKYLFSFILFLGISLGGFTQETKVGLVLSGGGADALAHIGVIKALEENNIPISYITGTSMGALIGALYASGVPVETIEAYFTSTEFSHISQGNIPRRFEYFYPTPVPDPTLISLRFKKNSSGYSLLFPSKVISSEAFDFDAVKYLAHAEKLAGYNFDSLKVPFRCVAADVITKKLVTFKDGSLTEALRASMSYPFFIKPIHINGHLMYDGGIYNNFPVDIMCTEFQPDFIIGSNVSTNLPPPSEDDLLGQLQNILVRPTKYAIYCAEGELIEPQINFGTFSFEYAQQAIDSGYSSALRHIKHIKHHVATPDTFVEVKGSEQAQEPIIIGEILFKGINQNQAKYSSSVIRRKKKKEKNLTLKDFERNYFRLYQELYIEDIRTKLTYNPITKKYDAIIDVSPIKSWTLDIGGNIATRPISEGFASLSYNNLSTYGFRLNVNTHYGKLYQALNASVRFDIPSKLPIYFKPKFVLHNWNWFESRQSNLFVTDKPDYVIEGEMYTGVEMGLGLGNGFRLSAEVSYLQMESDYYQTKNFLPADTADKTRFIALNNKVTLEANDLNKIQYPYEGSKISGQFTYTSGNEFYDPGSTSNEEIKSRIEHSFILLKLDYQQYLKLQEKLRFGFTLSAVYSNMRPFNNYSSSVIQAPAFKPTPDSKTLFLESFHADRYIGVGAQLVVLPLKRFQVRAEGYIFQPYQSFIKNEIGQISYGTPFADRFAIISAVISYETPIGPLSFSTNYYYNNPDISPEEEAPVTVLLNFGYIIFNKTAYH